MGCCWGTAMWAFNACVAMALAAWLMTSLSQCLTSLIPLVSLNEAWGKSDSLSFSGNDRFAKRGPGKCLPHAMQLGVMCSSLWPSVPFPSTFKISIATFLLTTKTRRLSSILHFLYMKWMCWARKRNCLKKNSLHIKPRWHCFIKTTCFDSLLHTPALQEAAGRRVPPSWTNLWLLQRGTAVLAAALVHYI